MAIKIKGLHILGDLVHQISVNGVKSRHVLLLFRYVGVLSNNLTEFFAVNGFFSIRDRLSDPLPCGSLASAALPGRSNLLQWRGLGDRFERRSFEYSERVNHDLKHLTTLAF